MGSYKGYSFVGTTSEYLNGRTVSSGRMFDENKLFEAVVYMDDILMGMGQGKSKKEAEMAAAKNALEKSLNRTVNKVQIYSIYLNKLINF